MPVKILLADKSITIQKVVEMLFSGREYEVACVSDGETALSEASRIVPDVVLADIDLPRVDGYAFAGRIRQNHALAQTPVILMMSRDDVFDEAKGRQSGIIDHIIKPFESQDLIGKVKKAISVAPPRLAEPAPAAPRPAAPKQPPAAQKTSAKPKPAAPADIFEIISEAPTRADLKRPAAKPAEDEGVFEVEPEVEVEEPLAREMSRALPVGDKAVEEMRAGLGLSGRKAEAEQEIVPFEALDLGKGPREYVPPKPSPAPRRGPETAAPAGAPTTSDDLVRKIAEETITRIAHDYFRNMQPPAPKISEDTVRRGIEDAVAKIARAVAREVIEKVAWEVIPDLAEMLIKAEIERLKAET